MKVTKAISSGISTVVTEGAGFVGTLAKSGNSFAKTLHVTAEESFLEAMKEFSTTFNTEEVQRLNTLYAEFGVTPEPSTTTASE